MRLDRFGLRILTLGLATSLAGVVAACGGGGSPGAGNTSLVKLTTTGVVNGTTGVAYTQQLTANFPHSPGLFVITAGALPPGLALDKQTGLISGYPRQTGSFQFEIAARDGVDQSIPLQRDANFAEDRKTFALNIALGLPNILPQQPPSAQYRASYQYQIDVAGGTAPYTFALTSAANTLPAGITVSPTGLLGSFPTQATQHPYTFQVTVTDALGKTDTETLTLDVVVLPLIILTSSPIQSGAQGFAYDVPLDLASSGGGQPITWHQFGTGLYPPGHVTNGVPDGGLPEPTVASLGDTLLSTIGMEIANVAGAGRFRVALPNTGPTALGTFFFTAAVTDEANQLSTRRYQFTVSAGPVLTSISPNKSVLGAPIVLTGTNFQQGAVVIFKPGPSQVTVTPNSINVAGTSAQINSVPGSPGGGFVTVRLKNPDGGFSDIVGGYAFPATNMTFSSTAIFPTPNSSLSSRGVDAGDVNKDGFADFVHCGSTSTWRNATGNSGGVDLMLNNPPGGVFVAATPNFTRVQLATTGDWQEVRLADVDADGDLDVVAVGNPPGSASVRVWLNPYPAAFTAAVVPITTALNSAYGLGYAYGYGVSTPHVNGLAVGKITNDALPDIVYAQQDFGAFTSTTGANYGGGRVSTMRGLGNGGFSGIQVSGQSIVASAGANGVGIVPATSGGRGNIVTSDSAGGFQQLWNGGGQGGECAHFEVTNTSDLFGSWTAMIKSGGAITECLCVATGDTNGDGIVDCVIPTGCVYNAGTQGVWSFVNSGSTFSAVQSTAGSSGAVRYATIFDIDFDNVLDLATTVATNKVDFFKGRTGTLGYQYKATVTTTTNSPNVSFISNGDFDKDGRIDVVVCTSHLADNTEAVQGPAYMAGSTTDRGLGGQQGVFILLNTSN